MSKLYQYIVEKTTLSQIDKKVAIEMLTMLKKEEMKTIKDIAIVGISIKLPKADTLEEFWRNLRDGRDCITSFPSVRKKDIDDYLSSWKENIEYRQAGYLKEIDKFDYDFFRLSPREARLMDPNQRLFLETAWKAIEDSGYGGKKLSGTRTGVYVGFSEDFSEEYKKLIVKSKPEFMSLSVTGNIKSIIASRISYLLDLKGPSMMIDTACSSALVAVHLACQAIRKGDCDQAIAGGVKVKLIPIKDDNQVSIGVESSSERAKTFDDSSDGTGLGEGVVAIMLKPLQKALEDRDNIYAVIKGSAINQDGSSIGITAPNALAQADVIERAWKDAEIDPETISYIEAHGTGTKLGDPIEIDGITKAFSKYTQKQQFCGVGAVKTNIGHLDNTSGIAGLVKTVLALQHHQLPPTVHFEKPNQKINFERSPVYVVDHLEEWDTDKTRRRCGISSFGLSGTNCHLILEEAPQVSKKAHKETEPQILTLSARTDTGLKELIQQYKDFVDKSPELDISDLCYTANTGRGHYKHRLALVIKDKVDLQNKLMRLQDMKLNELDEAGIYYGTHRIVLSGKERKKASELTEEEKLTISNHANLKAKECSIKAEEALLVEIAQLYIQGAEVEWDDLYTDHKKFHLSLPTYPFERTRCWVERMKKEHASLVKIKIKEIAHPLIDQCLAESISQDIYLTEFSIDSHWVLAEHRVGGNNLIPGTAYLEIAREACRKYYPDSVMEIKDAVFIGPLIVNEGEVKEVQTIIKKEKDHLEYIVASQNASQDRWIKHSEGKIFATDLVKKQYDLEELKQKFAQVKTVDSDSYTAKDLEFGPRWRSLKKVYIGTHEILGYSELGEEYEGDLREYYLHPSLMDTTVNVAIQSIGGLYLPFSYGSLKIYGPMPARVYSYIRRRDKSTESLEAVAFDVSLMDETGNVFAEITDYTVRRVQEVNRKFKEFSGQNHLYYGIGWRPEEIAERKPELSKGNILIFKDKKGLAEKITHNFRTLCK